MDALTDIGQTDATILKNWYPPADAEARIRCGYQRRTGLIIGAGVAEWVCTQLDAHHDIAMAEGIGWAKNGNIVAGVLFDNYNGASINAHIAVVPGERISPTLVAAWLDYPFRQLGLKRITCLIAEENLPSRRFAEHLGAKQEVVLTDALPSGNLVIYGLLKADAKKWLTSFYSRRLKLGVIDDGKKQ